MQLITADEDGTPTAMHVVQSIQAHGDLVEPVDDNHQVPSQAGDLLINRRRHIEAFSDPLRKAWR